MDDWNVLATSVEGARPIVLAGLRRRGAFRGGGYRNVAIGWVDDVPAFLDGVRDELAADPHLAAALARVLPIVRTFRLDEHDAVASIESALLPLAGDLAGRSFYVRLERRGLRDALPSSAVERRLGDVLWGALEAAGHTPRVSFADPDVVVTVETLGTRAGIALLGRATRTAYPFVRVR